MDLQKGHCVAIFSNTFWSIYNFRRSLVIRLQEQGLRVVAVSADDRYREVLEEMGCETIVIKNLDAKSTSLLKELLLLWEIRRVIKKLPCQYIYTFTIKPNVYTAIANLFGTKKAILTVNGLGNVFSGNNLVRTISLQLFRLAFRQAHKIIFQNREDYSFFQKQIGLNEKKVHFVRGSGVNTAEFRFSQRNPTPGQPLIFLLACRLLKEKGVYEYIEAARRVKNTYKEAHFWLIGMKANNQSAIDRNSLRLYEEQGNIQLMPPTDDVNGLLEQVDVLVLPSYYKEGVPRILLEGLGKGLPIITTDSVGCRETVIEGRNGYLVPPRDVDALEAAIRKIIALSTGERAQMRRESRLLAEKEFDEAKVIDTYIQLLHDNNLQVALGSA